LNFTWFDGGTIPKAIFVLQGARDDIAQNFHVAVRVGAKASRRPNNIIINDAQWSKTNVSWVLISAK
jgi:hypothetical protein